MAMPVKTHLQWITVVCAGVLFVCSFAFAEDKPVVEDKPAVFSEEWVSCSADSECVVIDAVCDWAAVNRKSIAEAHEYYLEIYPFSACSDVRHSYPRPAAACIAEKCQVFSSGKEAQLYTTNAGEKDE